jgi:hypothetical protein
LPKLHCIQTKKRTKPSAHAQQLGLAFIRNAIMQGGSMVSVIRDATRLDSDRRAEALQRRSRRLVRKIGTGLACLFISLAASAAPGAFSGKRVSQIHGGDSRPCIFFTLQEVDLADPVVPTGGWFALPRSHPGFKETYALLVAAKLTQSPLFVATSGVLVAGCGHVGVDAVVLQ